MVATAPRTSRPRSLLITLLLSLLTITSLVTVAAQSASASIGSDDYPYASYDGPGSNPATDTWTDSNGNPYSPYGFVFRNCTDFVAWRLNNDNGATFSDSTAGGPGGTGSTWGNGAQWSAHAGSWFNSIPGVGSVAQWAAGYHGAAPTYGHVAYVDSVAYNGDGSVKSIVIEEYNYTNSGAHDTRTLTPSGGYWPSGFIHVRDMPGGTGHKADIVGWQSSGNVYAGISTGGAFTGWGTPWVSGVSAMTEFGVGDFNKDGRSDIVGYQNGNFYVGESYNGQFTGWGTPWLTGIGQPTWFGVGDFNGDGYADIVSYEGSRNCFAVGLSTGHSFTWQPNWLCGVGGMSEFGVGDFNNDQKSDIVGMQGSSIYVGLSVGNAFHGWGTAWLTGISPLSEFGVGDFNGDGKADIVGMQGSSFYVGESNGSQFTGWGNAWVTGISTLDQFAVGDVNGDSRADIIGMQGSSIYVGESYNGQFTGWGTPWVTGISTLGQFAVGDVDGT